MSIVFISYSHDSGAHKDRVLGLSERLRKDGFETRLDQYVNGAPMEKWTRWMLDWLDEAQFVLVVCTETYYRRFRGHEEPEKGKGVDFEGALITQEIYDARSKTLKFVPVLFAAEDEKYIPEPLRGLTHYTLTSEASYEALHDFMRDQAAVEPGPVGEPRRKERRRGTPLTFDEAPKPSVAASEWIAPSRLRHSAAKLFGRDDELAALDAAWENPAANVLSIVAWGGVGKTSLVATWAAQLAARGYNGARYFDWSFYSQGTRDQTSASSDAFIAKALEFFGDPQMAESPTSPWDKGARLAQLVARERTLLVLDGLEPMQYPPGPLAGKLRDDAMAALLRGLAQRNTGLCVLTTREQVEDLVSFRSTTAPEWKLEHLSVPAGVELLKSFGVRGGQDEIERLVSDVKGHALTLNLVGGYLARAHGGDIRKRDRIQFAKADAYIQGGHAFKVIAAYERWLGEGGETGARQLAILRLLGLFDRPADIGCLAALCRAPAIASLTESLVELREADWNFAVASLTNCGLVLREKIDTPVEKGEEAALDSHPLIREYFANRLRNYNNDAWRDAHSRLFDHLKDSTEPEPDTLAGLQPLYQAVAHGCQAGRHQEACDDVYYARIFRGEEFYSTKKLGAVGADLGCVMHFFDPPWSQVVPSLSAPDQGWVFSVAAFHLLSLGRLTEALVPMRAGLARRVQMEHWSHAAVAASNLSELQLALGDIDAAVRDGRQSIGYADRDDKVFQRMVNRSTLATALHQFGRQNEASAVFAEAEDLQTKSHPAYPLLYSLAGFRYCDLLLAGAEHAAWRFVLTAKSKLPLLNPLKKITSHLIACGNVLNRGQKMFEWHSPGTPLLDTGLDHLTLGRAAFYEALLRSTGSATIRSGETDLIQVARGHVGSAVNGIRHAGAMDHLPRALLIHAWLKVIDGDTDAARTYLDEAWQVASRGPMRLFMADIHLYRARLFHAVKPYPWGSPREDLTAARRLIEQCGYWRRKEELEDAEAAAEGW